MTNYIYDHRGNAVGFRRGHYMHGNAVGQISGSGVHKLSGAYVGELKEDMIVKSSSNKGNIGNRGNPGNPGSPGNPGNRGSRGSGANDASGDLFE
jgi:hypothetical protein